MESEGPHWQGVSVLLRCIIEGEGPEHWLWEERILLIKASTEERARDAAEQEARGSEHSFINSEGAKVSWAFSEVLQVYKVESENLESGVEVFSRFLRTEEIESMRKRFPEDF